MNKKTSLGSENHRCYTMRMTRTGFVERKLPLYRSTDLLKLVNDNGEIGDERNNS